MTYEMLGLCNGMLLFDELFYSNLPYLFCLVVLFVALLFRDDHQFIDGSRCERSSRSTRD